MKLVLHFIGQNRPTVVHQEWCGLIPPPVKGDKVLYNGEVHKVIDRVVSLAFEPQGMLSENERLITSEVSQIDLHLLAEKLW